MITYACRECSREVTGSPFRSTCPKCGGLLESRPRSEPGGIEG